MRTPPERSPAVLLASLLVMGLVSCSGDSDPTASGPGLTASVVATTNNQTGVAGARLAQSLRVKVDSAGSPKQGILVTWSAVDGNIIPASTLTDGAGIAAGSWTLDTVAGLQAAAVSVGRAVSRQLTFHATALAGPAADIERVSKSIDVPVSATYCPDMAARVIDRYGNPVQGQVVRWSVHHGPVTVTAIQATTDNHGITSAQVRPTGTEGVGFVEASFGPISGPTAVFGQTIIAASQELLVYLNPDGPVPSFMSAQNGSAPAADTLSVGQTIRWLLAYDVYAIDHSVISEETPALSFSSYVISNGTYSVSATPGMAGSYQYADGYDPSLTGTVLVK